MRTSPFRFLLILSIVVFITSGCASWTAGTSPSERTPLEQAKLHYAAASLDYEMAMEVALMFEREGKLTPAHKRRIYAAQEIVIEWAPRMRSALRTWELAGSQPSTYAQVKTILDAAFAEVAAVKAGR